MLMGGVVVNVSGGSEVWADLDGYGGGYGGLIGWYGGGLIGGYGGE